MSNNTENLYDVGNRDTEALGEYFLRHMDRMTVERLDLKSHIAAELAIRDKEIADLKAQKQQLEHAAIATHAEACKPLVWACRQVVGNTQEPDDAVVALVKTYEEKDRALTACVEQNKRLRAANDSFYREQKRCHDLLNAMGVTNAGTVSLGLEILQVEINAQKAKIAERDRVIGGINKGMAAIGPRPKTAEEGLLILAQWFDSVYLDAGTGRDILQQDLRRWASEISDLQSKCTAAEKGRLNAETEALVEYVCNEGLMQHIEDFVVVCLPKTEIEVSNLGIDEYLKLRDQALFVLRQERTEQQEKAKLLIADAGTWRKLLSNNVDLATALTDAQEHRFNHADWIKWFTEHPTDPRRETIGDADFHQKAVVRYDRIIAAIGDAIKSRHVLPILVEALNAAKKVFDPGERAQDVPQPFTPAYKAFVKNDLLAFDEDWKDAEKKIDVALALIAESGTPRKTIEQFWQEQSQWSQATFGTDSERGPIGPLKHLEKEAREAQANPRDLMEFVDCLVLTFDATRRAGFSFDDLLKGAFEKLEINRLRSWSKPSNGDEPVEHDRDEESGTGQRKEGK